MAICFWRPQSAMIRCQSAMERPYFFSMEGKYDAGPCLGQGADCSVVMVPSFPSISRLDHSVHRFSSALGALSFRVDRASSMNGPTSSRILDWHHHVTELAVCALHLRRACRGYAKRTPCGLRCHWGRGRG